MWQTAYLELDLSQSAVFVCFALPVTSQDILTNSEAAGAPGGTVGGTEPDPR
jgi:hypothetical protein